MGACKGECTRIHAYGHAHMHMHMHMAMLTCTCTRAHAHVHTHTHMHMHMHMAMLTCTCTRAHAYAHTHVSRYGSPPSWKPWLAQLLIWGFLASAEKVRAHDMRVCMHMHIYIWGLLASAGKVRAHKAQARARAPCTGPMHRYAQAPCTGTGHGRQQAPCTGTGTRHWHRHDAQARAYVHSDPPRAIHAAGCDGCTRHRSVTLAPRRIRFVD